MTLLSIPSPSQGTWDLGPFPVRAYALCIIAGVIAAIWIAEKRWVARGGKQGQVSDLALWMVPFGLSPVPARGLLGTRSAWCSIGRTALRRPAGTPSDARATRARRA